MYENGMVPGAKVAPFLRAYLEESGEPGSDSHGSLPRILKRWEVQEWVEFASVDRIFCQISDAPLMLWLQIEEVYYAVNLDKARHAEAICQRRGCSKRIIRLPRGGPKKYCSKVCRSAAAQDRLRRKRGVAQRANLMDKCSRGHDMTPENAKERKNGTLTCRTCHRERERERYRTNAAHREKVKARMKKNRTTAKLAA